MAGSSGEARTFDDDVARLVRRELFKQSTTLHRRAALGGPPTIALVVVLFWTSAPRAGLLGWAGITLAANIASFLVAWRPSRRDLRLPSDERHLIQVMAVAGAIWGALPIFALPPAPEWQAMVGLLVFGFIAANTIFAAPSRAVFLAHHIGLVSASMLGFGLAGSGFAWVLTGVMAYGGVFAVFLHMASHDADLRAATESIGNQLLAAQVEAERARLATANDELRHLKDDFAHRATHDPLTGLANRELFGDHLERAIAAATRHDGVCAVLFIDLDRFKVVNDSLGHARGDELLRQVAERVQPLLRSGDVFARMGGDEFTVLLPSVASPQDAVAVAERILAAFSTPFEIDGLVLTVSPSIGVAHALDGSDTAADLLRHADSALYRAKDRGRHRVEVFDEGLRAQLRRRIDDEVRLRAAFASREIVAWYQPTVDLDDDSIVGAEALARWLDPDRGVLNAGSFVPIAEECGLNDELAQVIWRSTLEQRGAMVGIVPDDFRIRVNVNPREISHARLAAALLLFDRWGCPTSGIGVEVTEHALFADLDLAMTVLGEMRASGLTVELDDFGTGHSSLTLVTRLPVDGLKIDRSFVIQLESSASARAAIAAIVRLASLMDLSITAEGVETPSQAALLREMGVRYAQGFLWSPAVPGSTLQQWLVDGAPWVTTNRRPASIR